LAAAEYTSRRRGRTALVIGAVAAGMIILFVVPVVIMAAGWDMDMRGMHGGGRDTSTSPLVHAGSTAEVAIEDFAFAPGNLAVERGATVTWTNRDAAAHDATARGGAWETATLSRDESGAVTFDASGEYEYYCSIHPSMKARIVVR
jgi:plastocyanin